MCRGWGLSLVAVLALAGCATVPDSSRLTFESADGVEVKASPSASAESTPLTTAELDARGFVMLGTLTLDQVRTVCGPGGESCRQVAQEKMAMERLQLEAGRRGADVFRLETGPESFSETRYRDGACLEFDWVYRLRTMPRSGGMQQRQKLVRECVKHEQIADRIVAGQRYRASLWREPESGLP